MARQRKLKSAALDLAKTRLAGLNAINPKLDLGKGVTVKLFADEVAKTTADIDAYNVDLATLDARLNGIRKREKALNAMSVQAMRRIAADFGADSDEYEKIGGVRTSERKRPVKKQPKST